MLNGNHYFSDVGLRCFGYCIICDMRILAYITLAMIVVAAWFVIYDISVSEVSPVDNDKAYQEGCFILFNGRDDLVEFKSGDCPDINRSKLYD